MAMGECSASSSLQADSKVKFAAWPTSSRLFHCKGYTIQLLWGYDDD